jgi:predicted regulator of Ras-like GTPase activity (Roadblock/LC7/MglB family)
MAPPPAFASAVAPPPAGRLFSEEALDNSLDALFAGLEMGEVPAASAAPIPSPELPMATPATPKKAPTDNIVTFPGAGSGPIEEPAVAVAPPPPATPKTPSFTVEAPAAVAPPPPAYTGSGPVATPPLLVLSQGQDLRTLLATIDRTPGVTGSLLVGYDGLIIAFTLPPTVDRDYLAAQACNMFTGSSQHMQQLERGELRRMVLETATGAMLMTAADMGILVVVSDGQAMDVRGVSAAIAGALGQG